MWSVVTVLLRSTLFQMGFDPWTMAMTTLLAAGITLLVAAGIRSLPLDPLRRWSTWAIGGIRVLTTCCFSAALLYGSATTITLLSSVNLLVAAVGVYAAFGRRPQAVEIPGFVLIAVGVVLLAGRLDGGWSSPAIKFLIVSETAVVLYSLLTEIHPDNLGDRRQRLALTGFVTMLSATGLLAVWGVIGLAFPGARLGPDASTMSATLASPWLWCAALVFGVAFRAPLTYMTFLITRLVGADGYLLSMVALPVTTIVLELAAGAAGLLPSPSLDPVDLGYSAMIVAGGVWIIVTRYRRG
jgi:drug/metabolite transporter (DMT)-like permease